MSTVHDTYGEYDQYRGNVEITGSPKKVVPFPRYKNPLLIIVKVAVHHPLTGIG